MRRDCLVQGSSTKLSETEPPEPVKLWANEDLISCVGGLLRCLSNGPFRTLVFACVGKTDLFFRIQMLDRLSPLPFYVSWGLAWLTST